MNPLYGDLRAGDTFNSDTIGGELWMVVGVEQMPEKEGWIRMFWTFLEDPQYGVYKEERDGRYPVEEDWPLIQRGPL